MIVRISGEDQYLLDDEQSAELNRLEHAAVGHVESGLEDGFSEAFAELIAFVREHGTAIGEAEIETSDVILPPPDLTFEEAGREFTGDGLIPD